MPPDQDVPAPWLALSRLQSDLAQAWWRPCTTNPAGDSAAGTSYRGESLKLVWKLGPQKQAKQANFGSLYIGIFNVDFFKTLQISRLTLEQ